MELIMANGQMGASTYSIKPSLLQAFGKIGANPISRIAPERKKNRIFSGVGAESGKGLVESARLIGKQFEFEPSFDEYLKAMESVKTGRERRPAVGDNSRDKGEKIAKPSYLETSNGDFKSKLDDEENEGDLSSEWELGEGEEDDDDEVTSQSNATQRTTKDRMHQEVDSNERGFDVKRKYTNVQKTSNTERVTNFKGVDKWVRERKQSYDTSIGSTTSESSLDWTLNHWKTTSNGEMELGETRIWKRKSTPQRSEVDRQIHDYNISERKSSYGIERNVSVPEREKQGFRSSTEHLELDRNYSRTGDTRSIKSGKFAKGSKLLKEEDGEDDMEMERAAFKSFEVFTDLRGQPRVLRMEMEERIQHLAKWLNGTDINMPEWLFSKMIHSARIKFSDHSILRVIQILGTLGNWRRVLQVIEWLESRERFKSYKSRYIYTTALDVLGKAKRPVEALNVFHAMRKGMSSYPDLAAYHCIAVTLGQAGYVKELFDVIDCMRSPPPTKFNTG